MVSRMAGVELATIVKFYSHEHRRDHWFISVLVTKGEVIVWTKAL
jgi:hypothetical protein